MTNTFGVGVRYRESDYAGLFRRFFIIVIDTGFVGLLLFGGMMLDTWLMENHETYDGFYVTLLSVLISFIYLTKIKTSGLGTLGQMITRTRIETIHGTRPGIIRMTGRLLFWLIGPVNLVIDLLFLSMIREKRAVRDCICNTIVVKKDAQPVETGLPVRVVRVFAMGLNLMYQSCNSEMV